MSRFCGKDDPARFFRLSVFEDLFDFDQLPELKAIRVMIRQQFVK
jgi:hypothetical protein